MLEDSRVIEDNILEKQSPAQTPRLLRIAYIWQYESAALPPTAATALHVEAVIQSLERRGHSVRMITIRDGRTCWSDDRKEWHTGPRHGEAKRYGLFERGVRAIQGRLGLPYLRMFESRRFARACKPLLQDCDVAYERFWWQGYGGLLAARRLGIPLIYEVNGDLVEEYVQMGVQLSRGQWMALHWTARWMFTRAAHVVTVSEPLRERMLQRFHLNCHQVQAVSNGAQVELFTQPVESGVETCYGLTSGPLVMFVGSFKPWHGLDLLVEAFNRITDEHPQAKLVFVGDGPIRPKLEAQAADLGLDDRILFTGAVPHEEVAALLSAALVAVVNPRLSPASLSQSPLKLFEYMAAGKALIAPDIPNIREILEDGVTARLVPPDDSQALAAALDEFLSHPERARRLGAAARQQALERHSWDRTVAELERIFYAAGASAREPVIVKPGQIG